VQPGETLVFGIDPTVERRWRHKIAARGIYRDPVRSSDSHFVKASGLRWISLMLLTPIPWAQRLWALPVMTVLAPSERYYQQRGRNPQTLLARSVQMLKVSVADVGTVYKSDYVCQVLGACKTGTAPACPAADIHGSAIMPSLELAVSVAGQQCLFGPWTTLSVYPPGTQPGGCVRVTVDRGAKIPGQCF
jgi:hypothetical protein